MALTCFTRDAQGAFAIKWIDVTTKEILFFYAFKVTAGGTPQIAVFSQRSGTSEKLASTVQSFGPLADYVVGVIHINNVDHVGQVYEVQVIPPGKNASAKPPSRSLPPYPLPVASPELALLSADIWHRRGR